jgi:hypothetical protein
MTNRYVFSFDRGVRYNLDRDVELLLTHGWDKVVFWVSNKRG